MAFFGAMFAARTDAYALCYDNQRTEKPAWVPAVRGGWQVRDSGETAAACSGYQRAREAGARVATGRGACGPW